MAFVRIPHRPCRRCGADKPREAFPVDHKGRLSKPFCKPCYLLVRREKRAANRKPQRALPILLARECKHCQQTKAAPEMVSYKRKDGTRCPSNKCKTCHYPRVRPPRTGKPAGAKKLERKTCKDCGRVRERAEFLAAGRFLRTICRDCRKSRDERRIFNFKHSKRKLKPEPLFLTCKDCQQTLPVRQMASSLNKKGERKYYSRCKACANLRQRAVRKRFCDLSPETQRKAYEAVYRRTQRKRATVSEGFSRAEIIERDGCICYLCGRAIDRASIVIEHVVPLARNGHHTRANVRVACRPCNWRKGVKLLDEIEWSHPIYPFG